MIKSHSASFCLLFALPPAPLSLSGYEADAATEAVCPRRQHRQGQALYQPPPAAPAVNPFSASLPSSPHRYLSAHKHTHTLSLPQDKSRHNLFSSVYFCCIIKLVLTDTHILHLGKPDPTRSRSSLKPAFMPSLTLCKHLSISHASLWLMAGCTADTHILTL